MTDDPLVGDDEDDKFSLQALVNLSLIFLKQSSSYYQQLVLTLQMWCIQQQLSDVYLFRK